ncbi:MAG: hypothetical protein KDA20_12995 [Phycisphaerales bacterium]|nr:hypothetical protein [Phycisphaerales bacterium]
MSKKNIGRLVAACGAACGLAGIAQADPWVINISGATLFENFFRAQASTNDYYDVDGDGICGACPAPNDVAESLARPFSSTAVTPYPANAHWVVQYRSTGSGNGLAELVSNGTIWATGNEAGTPSLSATRAENAYSNREKYIDLNLPGTYDDTDINIENVGGYPFMAQMTGPTPYVARPFTVPGVASGGGAQIDLAVSDVPSAWFVRNTVGAPKWNRKPGAPGYGNSGLVTLNQDGTTATTGANLKSLGSLALYDPANPPPVNADNVIFDTPIAVVPVAAVVSFGVGYTEMEASNLRYLQATGRLKSGENLMAVTRDSGSGTRNGFQSSLGLDPSWGQGENVGDKDSATNEFCFPGTTYRPSNKGGSGLVELTVENTRLAIGHSGAERGPGRWLGNVRAECLGVKYDVAACDGDTDADGDVDLADLNNVLFAFGTVGNPKGMNGDVTGDGNVDLADLNIVLFNFGDLCWNNTYARPSIDNVCHNGIGGYNILGPESFYTIGDPRAEAPANGGDSSGLPLMRNQAAAEYLNNIVNSIAAFVALPGSDETVFSPGELLATNYSLVGATDMVQNLLCPTELVPNPRFNASLQAYTLGSTAGVPNNLLGSPFFDAFGNAAANLGVDPTGLAPTRREAGDVYSDFGDGGAAGKFITQGGADLFYGISRVPLRSNVCGDFNGDKLRNINDAGEMLKAWLDRQFASGTNDWAAPSGSAGPGSDACIEILGDFNADGSFDAEDVRYWADGLALNAASGKLERRSGFTAVDNAHTVSVAGHPAGNFFNTALATGAAYVAGDSRADVAGVAQLWTPGYRPIGGDGVVDGLDIDYVCANFGTWSRLNDAVFIDLSCDMNDDLVVDAGDVTEIVEVILGTNFGDVDLDGDVDGTDLAIAQGNLGVGTGWDQGDMNCDGVVDASDIAIITANQGM